MCNDPPSLIWAKERVDYWWKECHSKLGREEPPVKPTLSFSNRMTSTAGYAYMSKNHIQLSNYFMSREGREVFDETIGHEVAHIVAYQQFKDRGHGNGWKHVMRKIGLPPRACRSSDFYKPRTNRTTRYSYNCPCGQLHTLSANRMGRIRNGRKYVCLKCSRRISVVFHDSQDTSAVGG
jgi:SprT protein